MGEETGARAPIDTTLVYGIRFDRNGTENGRDFWTNTA